MPLECSFPLDKIWLLWKKSTPVQISAGFTGTQKTVAKSFGCVEGISMRNINIQVLRLQSSLKWLDSSITVSTNGINTSVSETKARNITASKYLTAGLTRFYLQNF